MCGIVGCIGNTNICNVLLNGLGELEYRGYDSAGIALLSPGEIAIHKAVGKLQNLKAKLDGTLLRDNYMSGIGHTRWATHGKPSEANAHPHQGEYTYVVHNGIIENYKEIKETLLARGHRFVSQTDTEVIVHLFESYFNDSGDADDAFEKTVHSLEGAYALLLVTKTEPEKIYFAKEGSPLIVALSQNGEVFFASSDAALIGLAERVCYLDDGNLGCAQDGAVRFFAGNDPVWSGLPASRESAQKNGFRYFMEKEIYEQSAVVADAMRGRLGETEICFDEIGPDFFHGIDEIILCSCGTSYHAALTASYLFERLAKVRCSVQHASEFRYREPLLPANALFVVISQSGETADTLEALKMAQRSGLKSLAVCNVDNSSIVRLADATLLTRAGIEKGVASTKAFATQTVILWMLALYVGRQRGVLAPEMMVSELRALQTVPGYLVVDENAHEKTKRLAKRYLHGHGFFFIGRDVFYPLALEGALKLKEISYLHAEGYPAGEMKHGPIALADAELFTIALMPKNLLYDKVKSNVEELSARDSTICAISPEPFGLADDFITVKSANHYMLEYFEMMMVLQLLALEIAVKLGNDVDMPRNLAKSVTVE